MARTLVVIPRKPRKAAKSTSNAHWRLAAALWRYLSQLAALPDRGATLDDLPPEYFRFPPVYEEPMTSIHVDSG